MTKTAINVFNFAKFLLLWEIGGCTYYMIEIMYRGFSHESMFILGGICLILVGELNELYSDNLYFELQVLIGDVIVLILEFLTGCIVNLWLGLNVWDYSDLPGNILGQVCPQFALMWMPIIVIAIILDDWIRWKYLKESKPIYRSFILEKVRGL